jgi:hypothetical protein
MLKSGAGVEWHSDRPGRPGLVLPPRRAHLGAVQGAARARLVQQPQRRRGQRRCSPPAGRRQAEGGLRVAGRRLLQRGHGPRQVESERLGRAPGRSRRGQLHGLRQLLGVARRRARLRPQVGEAGKSRQLALSSRPSPLAPHAPVLGRAHRWRGWGDGAAAAALEAVPGGGGQGPGRVGARAEGPHHLADPLGGAGQEEADPPHAVRAPSPPAAQACVHSVDVRAGARLARWRRRLGTGRRLAHTPGRAHRTRLGLALAMAATHLLVRVHGEQRGRPVDVAAVSRAPRTRQRPAALQPLPGKHVLLVLLPGGHEQAAGDLQQGHAQRQRAAQRSAHPRQQRQPPRVAGAPLWARLRPVGQRGNRERGGQWAGLAAWRAQAPGQLGVCSAQGARRAAWSRQHRVVQAAVPVALRSSRRAAVHGASAMSCGRWRRVCIPGRQ